MEKALNLKNEGNDELKQGNFFNAINKYTEALIHHKDPVYYTNRATVLIKMKKYHDSIEDCDQALLLDDSYSKAYYRKSENLVKMGKLEEALKVLQLGFKKASKNKGSILSLLKQIKDLKAKKLNLDKLIEKEEFEECLKVLGVLMKQIESDFELVSKEINVLCYQGDTHKASKFLGKYEYNLKHYDEPRFYLLKSVIFRYQNNRKSAMDFLEKGLKIQKNSEILKKERQFYRNIDKKLKDAVKQEQRKKFNEAINLYDEVLKMDVYNKFYNSDIRIKIAENFRKASNLDESLVNAEKSIELNPKNAKGFLIKAQLEKDLKKYIKAEQSIRMANILDPSLKLQSVVKEYAQLSKLA